jgi:hypothetical protein
MHFDLAGVASLTLAQIMRSRYNFLSARQARLRLLRQAERRVWSGGARQTEELYSGLGVARKGYRESSDQVDANCCRASVPR